MKLCTTWEKKLRAQISVNHFFKYQFFVVISLYFESYRFLTKKFSFDLKKSRTV